MAHSDLEMVRSAAAQQVGFHGCRSKLAEVLEKTMKAELIRSGWTLERTHDLERLLDDLIGYRSDLISNLEPLCDSLADAYFCDRYPGFDLDDPDWPSLHLQIEALAQILVIVEARTSKSS